MGPFNPKTIIAHTLSCDNINQFQIFTSYLIKAFSGYADKNKNRKITVKETFDYLYNEVNRESGGAQTPNVWGNFRKNLILMDNSQIEMEDFPEDSF